MHVGISPVGPSCIFRMVEDDTYKAVRFVIEGCMLCAFSWQDVQQQQQEQGGSIG